MTDDNDNDRPKSIEDGIEKVFGQVKDAFSNLAQPKKPRHPSAKEIDALFRAVKRNKTDDLKKVIDSGIDLDQYGPGGDTALHVAARNNSTAVAKLLLDAGANPKAPHENDPLRTPLADAVNFGKAEMAELLTRYGGYAPGQTQSNGFTLLHRACEKGNPRLVEAMINAGADSNERTGNGSTPLLVAIVNRQPEVAEKLLDFPAVAHGINEYYASTDPKRRTAFQLAVEKGQAPLVAKMLGYGSNVNAGDADGVTPLHHAIQKGNLDLIRTLIANGADLNRPDAKGETPAYIAAKTDEITDANKRAAIVNCLVKHGADPDVATPVTKMTPLHATALSTDGKETMAALLQYPVNKELADSDGYTPIFYTVHRQDTSMLKMLLDAGADANARCLTDARTPLIQAVHQESALAVKLLLEKGANPKLYDAHGKSALSYARDKKLGPIIAVLEEALEKQGAPRKKPKGEEWNL